VLSEVTGTRVRYNAFAEALTLQITHSAKEMKREMVLARLKAFDSLMRRYGTGEEVPSWNNV
jgi:hypothetical protein